MIEFISITIVMLVAAISPGPDFALVSRNSLRHSGRAGLFTSLGIAVGALFHAAYCILGISIIISQSILLFNAIKLCGAAYLIYLGVQGLLEKRTVADQSQQVAQSDLVPIQAFLQGLACNVLNPKAVVFFLSLFTSMISPSMSLMTRIAYGVEVAAIHLVWFALVAILFSSHALRSLLGTYYITKAFGAFLILFGLNIATMIE